MTRSHRQKIHSIVAAISLFLFCSGDTPENEIFDLSFEYPALQNIQQLTFSEMGFEKCGEAYFSPDSSTIIFQAVPKGQLHYQIYTLALSESSPRLVSTGKGACTCAYFRPDGGKIIFASSHSDPELAIEKNDKVPGYQRATGNYVWEFTPFMNIYEANPDGSELTALTSGPSYNAECAYSADGKRIVFASNESGSMNIYTMDCQGNDVYRVTQTDFCYNGGPFFSPNCQQIIFRADRDLPHYLDIYCCNIDGTNELRITNNGAVNWAPYWHPNGQVIAFTTSLHGHAHYEIYLQNIKTNVQYRLTHNASFDGLPVFSPDGKKIMWTSKRSDDGTCQIFIADFTLPKILY